MHTHTIIFVVESAGRLVAWFTTQLRRHEFSDCSDSPATLDIRVMYKIKLETSGCWCYGGGGCDSRDVVLTTFCVWRILRSGPGLLYHVSKRYITHRLPL